METESKLSMVFTDGSRVHFTCPPPNVAQDPAVVLQAAIDQGSVSVEVDGDLVIVPFANVKYMRLTPAPARITGTLLRGARLSE